MKILIVGPSWVGDAVMAQSLFKIIKDFNPDSKIDVLSPEWASGVLNRMDQVNNLIFLQKISLKHLHENYSI